MADIVETIRSWPARQKIALLFVLAVSVAGLVLLFSWVQRPDYHILYSSLSEGDAGAIVQKLGEMRVPYQVRGNGVFVPRDKVYDLRLQLAAEGLPQGGVVGFELFDKTDFGTTDFVQKLNYRRAMQGELARTIMSLSEVQRARVHLAIPERSLFLQEGNEPSASVLVELAAGRSLAQSQVQGIVHLVSSSVEGLQPGAVTLVNNRGEMLTRRGDETVGLSGTQIEYQKSYEKEMESRVMGILEPVIGKDKVRAEVAAEIDFTRTESTEESFDPEGAVVRSEQKTVEKSTSQADGGVPGVASNIPGKTGARSSSTGIDSKKQNEVVNYELSRVTRHVINASGQIKRLSVAVLVDGVYAQEEGSDVPAYTPRSEEELRHYEELVKGAIGFSAERGDEVRVMNIPFETVPQEELPEPEKEYLPMVITVAKYLAPTLAVILFFFIVLRPLMKVLSTPTVVRQVAEVSHQASSGLGGPQEKKALGLKGDVLEWAGNNPRQAADLIKGWMEEKK
jgi:flagellar M-ring protein FliF